MFLTDVCCLLRSLETGPEQSPLRLDGAERTYVCAFLLLTTVTRKTYRRMRSHILRDHGLQSLNLIHSLHTRDIILHYTVTYEMYHKMSCDNFGAFVSNSYEEKYSTQTFQITELHVTKRAKNFRKMPNSLEKCNVYCNIN